MARIQVNDDPGYELSLRDSTVSFSDSARLATVLAFRCPESMRQTRRVALLAAMLAVFGVVMTVAYLRRAGSDNGGRTVATLCTFIASCQRHEIDPFAYLRDVLTQISACPINDLDRFLPDRWRNGAHIDT